MRLPLALIVALVCAVSVAAGAPIAAGRRHTIPITSRTEKHGKKPVGVILIGGQVAATILTPYSGSGPADRARIAAAKLWLKIDDGAAPSTVRALEVDDRWTVSIGDSPVLYVTRREARAQESDADALARRWAARIRDLLAMPALKLSAGSVVVPLNESRSVSISGWLAKSPESTVPEGALSAGARVKGKTLVVHGLKPGTARVEVFAGNHSVTCRVTVRKYAADLSVPVRAQVTGRPAPAGLVSQAALLALKRFLKREPGTNIRLVAVPKAARPLAEGRKTVLTAKISVFGANYLSIVGTARIDVENTRIPPRIASQLMYSNVPEQISRAATLYFAEIPSHVSSRLFYHHINTARAPAILAVTLVNPAEKPVRLQIVPGFVFPHLDPVQAGRRAGSAFFPRYLKNIGEIYTLPPRSAIPLAVDLLKPQEVGSGMAEVRLLEPDSAKCYVRVTASYQPADSAAKAASGHLDAWRQVMPRPATAVEVAEAPDSPDLFPTTVKQVNAEYTVGEKWTWIPFGKEPITDSAGTRRLEGNYGVLYNIDLKVHNPGEQKRQVEVAFEAGAGPASGVFAIADKYVEVTSIYPREERALAKFTLGPNQTRKISIQTVPLGGSAYPASLIVR